MPETIIVKGEGITLDLLLHRKYGVPGRALMPTALTLNPGVSDNGPFIPLGTSVVIPDLPASSSSTTKVVTLFGET